VSPEPSSIKTKVDGRELTLSNLDKVLYPADGFTKGQMIDYYVRIAAAMLPHLADRPLTMKRYPDGVEGGSFFEKHLPAHAPSWARHAAVPRSDGHGSIEYGVVCDLPTLVWAANLGSIEFHVPLWRVGNRRRLPGPPDYLVFDLDPGPGTSIVECCTVARHVREVLDGHKLQAKAKTSGSKGLQLYAPLRSSFGWDKSRELAHDIAHSLEGAHPDLIVSNMRKELRKGKVLIDWSQNHPSKTTVAAYSLRARSHPTVSTPVTWDEVSACEASADAGDLTFVAADVLARFDEQGDLFAA